MIDSDYEATMHRHVDAMTGQGDDLAYSDVGLCPHCGEDCGSAKECRQNFHGKPEQN